MRKTVSGGLLAIGLAVAIFGAPTAAWAESGEDRPEDKGEDTVVEQVEDGQEEEPEYEAPAAEPESEAPAEEYAPPADEYTEPAPEEWVEEYPPPEEGYTEPEYTEPEYVEPENTEPEYAAPADDPEFTEPSADDPGSDEVVTGDEPAAAPDAVAPEEATTTDETTEAVACDDSPGRGHGNDADGMFVGPVAPVGPPSPEACEVSGDDPAKEKKAGSSAAEEDAVIAAISEPGPGETHVYVNEGHIGAMADDPVYVGSTEDCTGVTMAGQDAWVFVLPGSDAQWVELEASFTEDGTISEFTTIGQGEANMKGVIYSPSGYTLSGAEALITGGLPGQGEFQLTHTCPGGPGNPPPPRCTPAPCEPPPPPPCEEEPCTPPPCEQEPCTPPPPPPCEEEPCVPPPPPPVCEEEPCTPPPPPVCAGMSCEQPPEEVVCPPVDLQPPAGEQGVPPVIAAPPVIAEAPAEAAVAAGFAAPAIQGEETLPVTGRTINVLVGIGLILLTAGGLALLFGDDRPFARRFHD
ncbi:hypothetical protein [Phytomonospora endophytica]|uniref:LPXTG-motif cell wall-anchored protein n=1 Tax=Phytomonospora endophytica TaxID=714109 RepID=A0A841FKQ8_9ACTN|nr:hypothetical protein [Phytomonospora endophytica]MBB6035503.1 hypothetical protein [Phytomonospora endophytica]